MAHRLPIAACGRNQNYKLQNTNYKQITINKKQTKNRKQKKSSPYFLDTCKPHQKKFTRESYKNCCNKNKKLKDSITD